jgi:hypothetical protein
MDIRVEPLLCNDREISKYTRAVSRQRLGKHFHAATDTHVTIKLQLETVFSSRSVKGVIRKSTGYNVMQFFSRVEVGSNTSTVTLRAVGGDKKRILKSETVKYGRESQRTRTRERLRWQGLAGYTKDRPVLSSERAPHNSKTVTVKQ